MKKQIISAALSAALVLSSALAAGPVNASAAASDYNLPENTADGVILHCFDWSFNAIKENLPEIAAAGYTAVQTSPVQQPKDYGEWLNGEGQWWKLYQPLSFSIAQDNSWLGTKDELASLCAEAENYGVKVIVDIVSNHMANQSGNTYLTVCHDIKEYEPDIYKNQKETFHQLKKGTSDDNKLEWIVQGELDYLPDLNTSNELVQSRVISLLEECIDVGVDGFRFDAAKHIETPNDGEYASDFWPNITGAANQHAADAGVDLYMYGEILNTPGKGRSTTDYTQYLDVIDNKMGNGTLAYVRKKNAKMTATALNFTYDYDDPSNFVVWAESHDTYMGGSTKSVTNEEITKTWALVAARADAHPLYFARPNELMGLAGDTNWKSTVITEVNKFHNKFAGVGDSVFYEGDAVAVQRGDAGIVIVNLGDSPEVSLTTQGMKDGTYADAVTGSTFTVSGGVISGSVGESGVAVVYEDASETPKVHFSSENTTFRRNTYKLTLSLENAESGTYAIDGGAPVSFTGTTDLYIGDGVAEGSDIKVVATATKGDKTVEVSHTYTKEQSEHTGRFVYYDNSTTNYKSIYAYCYYEIINDQGRKESKYKDSRWPGVKMEYDEEKGLYSFEIPSGVPTGDGSVILTNAVGWETPELKIPDEESIYDEKQKKLVSLNGVTLMYGDLSGDETIASDDALLILRYSAGLAQDLRDSQIAQADVDGDGTPTSADALAVLRVSASLEAPGTTVGEMFTFGGQGAADTDKDTDTAKDSDKDTDKGDAGAAITPSGNVFYAVNNAGAWLFADGCKLWLYNRDTKQAVEMTKETYETDDSKYSYVDIPTGWVNLDIYRTSYDYPYDPIDNDDYVAAANFDTEGAYNYWILKPIPEGKNAYSISDNNVGKFKNFTP